MELETQLSIAHDLGYVDKVNFQRLEGLCGETGRILNGLVNRFEWEVEKVSGVDARQAVQVLTAVKGLPDT